MRSINPACSTLGLTLIVVSLLNGYGQGNADLTADADSLLFDTLTPATTGHYSTLLLPVAILIGHKSVPDS